MTTHRVAADAHIGSIPAPSDRFWRRWVENPYAFFLVPLGIATAVLVLVPGHSWRERVLGVVIAALTAWWFQRWRLQLRADPLGRALAHRLWLAFVGVVLTSVLSSRCRWGGASSSPC
jgi:hypothetical protein